MKIVCGNNVTVVHNHKRIVVIKSPQIRASNKNSLKLEFYISGIFRGRFVSLQNFRGQVRNIMAWKNREPKGLKNEGEFSKVDNFTSITFSSDIKIVFFELRILFEEAGKENIIVNG